MKKGRVRGDGEAGGGAACLKVTKPYELLFLPFYRPDFNPIEQAFSNLKVLVRKHKARTMQALDDAIAAALTVVSLQDVIGWFNHAG